MIVNAEKPEAIDTLQAHQDEINLLLNELGLNLRDFNLRLGLEENQINPSDIKLLDIRI